MFTTTTLVKEKHDRVKLLLAKISDSKKYTENPDLDKKRSSKFYSEKISSKLIKIVEETLS